MTNSTTNSNSRGNAGALSFGADDAVNPRSVLEDLKKVGDSSGYLVAVCATQAIAERALTTLTEAGFKRDELVLVANRIGTLRPGERGDAFEVRNPASEAQRTGAFAGGTAGVAAGAAFGLIASFLAFDGTQGRAIMVAAGAAIFAVIGTLAGSSLAAKMRRAPAEYFDEKVSIDDILVGVDLGSEDAQGRSDRSKAALQHAGLTPRFIPA